MQFEKRRKMSQHFLSPNFVLVLCFLVTLCYSYNFDFNPWLLQSHRERIPFDIEVSGKFQSPVNIDRSNVQKIQLKPLIFKNFNENPFELSVTNTGHSLQVSGVWDELKIPTISGGNLSCEYKFVQFHFHWGESNFDGSEHTVNNVPFASELHAVFIRSDLDNFQNALQYADGIVVVGFFISISSSSDPAWGPLTEVIPSIQEASESVNIRPSPIDSFLEPDFVNLNYFTYFGSLTTPPYSENVQWIIAANSGMIISPKQLDAFRSLLGEDGKPILENHRQLQDLCGRTIYNVQYFLF